MNLFSKKLSKVMRLKFLRHDSIKIGHPKFDVLHGHLMVSKS